MLNYELPTFNIHTIIPYSFLSSCIHIFNAMNASQNLTIYNSLTGQKEPFEPINEGRVGMYVCGPTLYSEPHMGNMRTFINFDMIYRYLLALGYQVKYVRNITD